MVALEFATAVSTFVSATLLPTVAADLHARAHLGLLLAGTTIGLFTALPLAARVLRLLRPLATLTAGLSGYLAGLAAAATARTAWTFAAGMLVIGFAGGLLAVYGMSAVIRYLDDDLRARVIAASSATWIVPALIAPPATLLLQHAIGWRWTMLLPVPVVLVGRLLVVRVVRTRPIETAGQIAQQTRPLARTLLVPAGVAALVLTPWWPVAVAAAVLAMAGLLGIVPAGTARAGRGTPAALAAMVLFAIGYFGADSMITMLLADGYRAGTGRAAVVLSAGALAWGVTSVLLARWNLRPPPAIGLAVAAVGVVALAAVLAVSRWFPGALTAWTLAGTGIGIAYPSLYLRCTTSTELDATDLATAVITAESFGALFGRAGGGAIVSLGAGTGMSVSGGLIAAYAGFAGFLAAAAVTALGHERRE